MGVNSKPSGVKPAPPPAPPMARYPKNYQPVPVKQEPKKDDWLGSIIMGGAVLGMLAADDVVHGIQEDQSNDYLQQET